MRQSLLPALVLAPLMLVAPSSIRGREWSDATTTVAPPQLKKRCENNGHFEGTVTAVTARSITIQGTGWQCVGPQHVIEGLRTLVASEWVAPGGVPAEVFSQKGEMPYPPEPPDCYRLADIRVGDKVDLKYVRIDGVDVAISARILRRPGGKVPPCPGARPDRFVHWHELANAYQEYEERGETPPPDIWERIRQAKWPQPDKIPPAAP